MLNLKSTVYLAAAVAVVAAGAAQAEDYLSFNAGYYDAIRQKNTATQFGIEYRFSELLYSIHPIIGGFITTDNAKYGYAGFNWNVALLPNQLYLVPNFAVGAYSEGDGRRLGGPLEFRSGIELDYQLPNTQQIGVALNHISNASIYTHNPGEESIIATYSVPIHTVVGLFNQ